MVLDEGGQDKNGYIRTTRPSGDGIGNKNKLVIKTIYIYRQFCLS